MKKLLIVLSIILLLLVSAWLILESTRKKNNQSKEISLEFAKQPAFVKDNLQDLPLLRFESKNSPVDYFVILIPGDGGWRDFIDYLSGYMAGNGINVVGFNTIPYFNMTRKPSEIAHDISRVIHNFSEAWGQRKVVLAGYSFGAEIIPFVYNSMDSATRSRISCLTLIAPSNLADFKVSPIYYYNPKFGKPVLSELEKIHEVRTLVFCDKQKKSICKYTGSRDHFDVVQLDYGHMFTGKFKNVSATITNSLIREMEKK